MKQVINLVAMDGFNCLGPECSRSCCSENWCTELDRETLLKWNSQPTDDKNYLLSQIDENSQSRVLKKRGEFDCIALNKQKLCEIQIRYGHEFLPKVCRDFPRSCFENDLTSYRSASFSCPEIVDRVFSVKPDAPIFKITEVESGQVTDKNIELLTQADKILTEILGQRKIRLGALLVYITDVFNELLIYMESGQLDLSVLHSLKSNLELNLRELDTLSKSGQLKPNPITAGSYWKSVYSIMLTADMKPYFLPQKGSDLDNLLRLGGETHSAYQRNYQLISILRKKSKKELKDFQPMLRKYIKLYFPSVGFPLNPKREHRYELITSMLNLSVFQLLLWTKISKGEKVTSHFIKECIVEVDRHLVQNTSVSNQLQSDPHMMQINQYCLCFSDLF